MVGGPVTDLEHRLDAETETEQLHKRIGELDSELSKARKKIKDQRMSLKDLHRSLDKASTRWVELLARIKELETELAARDEDHRMRLSPSVPKTSGDGIPATDVPAVESLTCHAPVRGPEEAGTIPRPSDAKHWDISPECAAGCQPGASPCEACRYWNYGAQHPNEALVKCWRCKHEVPESTTVCNAGIGTQCKDSSACRGRWYGEHPRTQDAATMCKWGCGAKIHNYICEPMLAEEEAKLEASTKAMLDAVNATPMPRAGEAVTVSDHDLPGRRCGWQQNVSSPACTRVQPCPDHDAQPSYLRRAHDFLSDLQERMKNGDSIRSSDVGEFAAMLRTASQEGPCLNEARQCDSCETRPASSWCNGCIIEDHQAAEISRPDKAELVECRIGNLGDGIAEMRIGRGRFAFPYDKWNEASAFVETVEKLVNRSRPETAQPKKVPCVDCGELEEIEAVYCRRCQTANCDARGVNVRRRTVEECINAIRGCLPEAGSHDEHDTIERAVASIRALETGSEST